MAILGREFIAAPDSSKRQIVYKWPDQSIRKFTRCIVEPDAVAVFTSQGQVMGTLLGGQHQLDARELPFLGMFIDWATDSRAFRAELYFVGIRDFPGIRFGGRLDEVQDPQTGLIVTLRTFGEYALRVVDAPRLILNLTGTVDVTSNDAITGWVTQQLLKVTRTAVTTQLMAGAWPILGLSVHSPEIEVAAMQAANAERGVRDLHHQAGQPRHQPGRRRQRPAEEARGRHRVQPAGRRVPAGGAGRGAAGRGRGVRQGRRGVDRAAVPAGLGMAGQVAQAPGQAPYNPPPPGPGFAGGGPGFTPAPQQPQPQATEPQATQPVPGQPSAQSQPTVPVSAPAAAGMTECANCHGQVPAGGKFCPECGQPMQRHCTNCNASLSPTARFCAECGTPANPPAS